MKNNLFNTSELAQIKSFYQNELERTQQRLRHIIEVLSKLEKHPIVDVELLEKTLGKAKVTASSEAPVEAPPARRRGRPRKVETLQESEATTPKTIATKPTRASSKTASAKTKSITKATTPKAKAKTVRKPRATNKPIKVNVGAKKLTWADFIQSSLVTDRKPLSLADLANRAVKELSIPEADADRAKMAIAGTLNRMKKDGKLVTSIKLPEQRGAGFYVLIDWLDGEMLKPEFSL